MPPARGLIQPKALNADPPGPPPRSNRRRMVYALLMVILTIGAAIRLYGLGRESFWFNEAASVYYAKGTLSEVVQHSFTDETNPPGFHLLIHFWMKIAGMQEWVLRLPSALAGSLSLIVMYFFSRKFLGRPGSLAAAALLALAPLHVWYSQECRAFAIWVLLILSAYLSFLKWLETRRPLFATLNVLFTIAAIAFHYFGFHVILIENMFLLANRKTWADLRCLKHWLASQACLALGLVPLALMMLRVDRSHVAWWQDAGIHWQVVKSLLFQLNGVYYFLSPEFPLKALTLFINGCLLLLGLRCLRRGKRAVFPLLAIGVPIIVNLSYSLGVAPILGNSQSAGRYFLLTLPPYLILLAAGWEDLWRRFPRSWFCVITLAGLLTLNGLGVRASRKNTAFNRDDNRRLIGKLLSRAAPGEWIIASPVITLEYYAERLGYDLKNYRILTTSRFDQNLELHLPAQAQRIWFYLDPAHHFSGLMDQVQQRYGLSLLLADEEKKLSGAGVFMAGRREGGAK